VSTRHRTTRNWSSCRLDGIRLIPHCIALHCRTHTDGPRTRITIRYRLNDSRPAREYLKPGTAVRACASSPSSTQALHGGCREQVCSS
jgi:hypothetical protein